MMNTSKTNLSRPIMVIDGLNLFTRNFVVNETTTATGELVGGVVGFIRALGNLINQFHPASVYVVWEQGGPSQRRKHICPDYKANRLTTGQGLKEMYRADGKFQPSSNPQNKVFQLQLLTKALSTLPICQIYVQDTEADDVIAYLVKRKFQTTNNTKLVVSNDKDFYQLLEDPNVRIFDPATKMLIDSDAIKTKLGISPRNITLARAVIGDPSDNLKGVEGIGFKTLASRFAAFSRDDVDLDRDWLIKESKALHNASKRPLKCYSQIIEGEDIIERNWKLMFLDTFCLSSQQIEKINYKVENFEPVLNKMEYLKIFTGNDIPISLEIEQAFSSAKTLFGAFSGS